MSQPFKRRSGRTKGGTTVSGDLPDRADASGIYQLNARVPADLAGRARGMTLHLPLGSDVVAVKASDKVFLSLRTKDGIVAKARHAAALNALMQHWEALRAGPKPLTHKQVVALAGDAYRRRTAPLDGDFDPDQLEAIRKERTEALHAWRYGDGDDLLGYGSGEISEESARFFEAIQRPKGPQLLAFETKRDVESPYVSVRYEDALEDLFGAEAERLDLGL